MSDSLWPHGLYSPWNSLGQNTGLGSLSLPQGIFQTQGSNPGLLHCRWILYQLSHQGSPRILEWVAYPFSSGSSWLRNQTGVSCIAGGLFTNWAIREAPGPQKDSAKVFYKRSPSANQEKPPKQHLTMLGPGSQTSSLQDSTHVTNKILWLKLPKLW